MCTGTLSGEKEGNCILRNPMERHPLDVDRNPTAG
jgi:hypothetical protein